MPSRSRYANPPPILAWYKGHNERLELQSLTDDTTGVAVTTATVTANLYDTNGSAISGITNPVTLDHVANGLYRKILPTNAGVEVGDRVTAEWTANDGALRVGFWRRTIEVQYA